MNTMTQTPNLKPGILTTEFWGSIATSLVGILILLGYVEPVEGDQLVQAVVAGVGGLLVLGTQVAYIVGRIKLKQSIVANSSVIDQVLNAPLPEAPPNEHQVYVE